METRKQKTRKMKKSYFRFSNWSEEENDQEIILEHLLT